MREERKQNGGSSPVQGATRAVPDSCFPVQVRTLSPFLISRLGAPPNHHYYNVTHIHTHTEWWIPYVSCEFENHSPKRFTHACASWETLENADHRENRKHALHSVTTSLSLFLRLIFILRNQECYFVPLFSYRFLTGLKSRRLRHTNSRVY